MGGYMLDRLERWYDKVGSKILYIVGGILFVYIFLKYLLGMLAPFLIGWGLAVLLNPFVTWLKRTVKVPRILGTIFSMIIMLSGLFAILNILVKQLWYQIISFTQNFPFYKEQIMAIIPIIEERLDYIKDLLPVPSAFSTLDNIVIQVLNSISEFVQTIIPWAYNIVSQVPNVIIFIIITIISTFFMTKDHQKIKAFVKAQIPGRFAENASILQNGLLGALGGYVRTQLIMMTLTFTICSTGLFIIKMPYVLLISLCIAIFDALPIFGSGAILIPWAIFNIIIGHYSVAIGLFCIYGLIFLSRQMIEPRILSGQIGVYALVTVMSMYIGYRTMGVIGLIVGPVSMVIIKTLQNTGVLPAFKEVPRK
jgi:sporulation integral membrane protein YtvI